MPEFPWPKDVAVLDVVDALRELPKWRTLCLLAGIRCLPVAWMAQFLELPREGDAEEAGLLFTSGSSGDPKGVVLSHRNILSNCEQISSVGLITKNEQVLANLPLFHSFGFTVTLWCPILTGCRIVSLPSPLEVKKAAEVIRGIGYCIDWYADFFEAILEASGCRKAKVLALRGGGCRKDAGGFC